MIMRDVNYGWLIRYTHANVASFFFIFVYIHIGKGIYYGSYKKPRVKLWSIGVIIFIVMMGTAFLGYLINGLKWFESIYILRNSEFYSICNHILGSSNNISILYDFSAFIGLSENTKLKTSFDKYITLFNKMKPPIKPIKIYDNLTEVSSQILLREENKHKTGIYMIFNLKNGKFYIGSAITNRINTRFRNHCIHGTGSPLLNKAINKYGLENFVFLILEYFPHLVNKENLKGNHIKLLELETNYINIYKPKYNILVSGFSSLGYKHNKETLDKMKANFSEARKQILSKLHKNKTLSENTKNLIREKALLRFNQNNINIKKMAIINSKPVILYNLDGTIHSKYPGIRAIARNFNCCHKTINKAIIHNKIFKYIGYIKYETKISVNTEEPEGF